MKCGVQFPPPPGCSPRPWPLPADALSFDLEDADELAAQGRRPRAYRRLLQTPRPWPRTGLLIVRVNAMDTPHFTAGDNAVVPSVPAMTCPNPTAPGPWPRPPPASPRRGANGVQTSRLLLNIRNPKALRRAAALAPPTRPWPACGLGPAGRPVRALWHSLPAQALVPCSRPCSPCAWLAAGHRRVRYDDAAPA